MRRSLGLGCAWALFLGGVEANAHIRLDSPPPRYPAPSPEDGSNLKVGPCGAGSDARTNDASRITTLEAGSTITVLFHETVHHASHYRIAFDLDGQDDFPPIESETDIVDPPVFPILADGIPDATTGADTYAIEVTLPSETCENCTLQLIQYMYDRAEPFYFQCADVRLVAPSGGTGGATSGTGGAVGATGGATNPNGTGGALGSGGTPSSAVPPASAGGTASEPPSGEASGCALVAANPSNPWSTTIFALATAVLLRLRRRTRTA